MQEKLIVLDLAEDNLINSNNYYYLKSLREKGVIHYNDGQLKLFNYSFRNFILSQINDQEIQLIISKISDGNSWKDFKYPIIIILVGVFWLVLNSDPDRFGNILPTVTALSAGVPTIIKIMGMLKGGEKA